VVLPPLRRRKEDIPLLIDAFSHRFCDRLGTKVGFAPEAVNALMNYGFPGNVRELLNVAERCIALASDKIIRPAELPPHITKTRAAKTSLSSLQKVTAEAEKNHIIRIVQLTKGNRSKAAEILGISRKTLWEKINADHLDL
jgi:DNA-binding NtrC family response regulator